MIYSPNFQSADSPTKVLNCFATNGTAPIVFVEVRMTTGIYVAMLKDSFLPEAPVITSKNYWF